MRSYQSVTLQHMEENLEVREQFKKYFNMVFFGPAYSRILKDAFKIVIYVKERAPFQEETKCL